MVLFGGVPHDPIAGQVGKGNQQMKYVMGYLVLLLMILLYLNGVRRGRGN